MHAKFRKVIPNKHCLSATGTMDSHPYLMHSWWECRGIEEGMTPVTTDSLAHTFTVEREQSVSLAVLCNFSLLLFGLPLLLISLLSLSLIFQKCRHFWLKYVINVCVICRTICVILQVLLESVSTERGLVATNLRMSGTEHQETSIDVTWTASSYAAQYKATLNTGSESTWSTGLSFTFAGLSPGTKYSFNVASKIKRNPGYQDDDAMTSADSVDIYTSE